MNKSLVIGGSPRKGVSVSDIIVDVIAKSIDEVSTWKLSEKPLPVAIPEWHNDPKSSGEDRVIELAEAIEKSEIVWIVTPVYHGSYTSHLKNALDCMYKAAFMNKMVILVGLGHSSTAILPCVHLQDVVRTMKSHIYYRFITVLQSEVNIENRTLDEKITDRINEIIKEVNR